MERSRISAHSAFSFHILCMLFLRPQLFEKWITQWISLLLILWIAIYPVDNIMSTNQRLNNRDQ